MAVTRIQREAAAPHAAPPLELPRALGAVSAASVLIGGIIGSGIFKKPSVIAEGLASPGWILACWVAAGALALIGSLIFAELGSIYPQAGGQYTFLRRSFGPFPAFLYGWTNLLIINAASLAALAFISTEFLFNLLPGGMRPADGSHWFRTVPVVLIASLALVNVAGVRWGAGIQNALTFLKLAALGLVIAGIFLPGKNDWSHLRPFWEIRGDPSPGAVWAGFKTAFLAIFWAYDGWYQLSFSGGEIRDPRRNIPIGFVAGILVVIGVYAGANVAYFGVLSLDEMAAVVRAERQGEAAAQGGVAALAALRLYGPVGLMLLSAGIVCSTFGAANANVLTGPRLSYAMARDGLFFGPFGRLHARFLTPHVAILVQCALGIACIYAGSFDQLTDSVVFAAWIFYLLTILGYFRLRRMHRHRDDVFRAPLYPLLPILFVVFASLFIAYSTAQSFSLALRWLRDPADARAADGVYLVVVLALIAAGLPVYRALRRGRS